MVSVGDTNLQIGINDVFDAFLQHVPMQNTAGNFQVLRLALVRLKTAKLVTENILFSKNQFFAVQVAFLHVASWFLVCKLLIGRGR